MLPEGSLGQNREGLRKRRQRIHCAVGESNFEILKESL